MQTLSLVPLEFTVPVVPPSRSVVRSSPLGYPLSLVCYCMSVLLRAAFLSVGLRACMSMCIAAQCTSHSDSQATCVCPGDILRLQHRLHAEPAYGRFIVIFASSRGNTVIYDVLCRGNPGGFYDLCAIGISVPSGPLDEAYTAYELKRQAP
ncbi:hypothetical protein EVAR_20906_1 [Eumeta japonica]|uniref:Uncharacterized protein n=1 Tax=Eumeta variegata TaxID=151549 RepID=A0A4C1UVC4_EUMVA|nr:hypothetical protein EVAR_20906_1 [Eumeta japonica]